MGVDHLFESGDPVADFRFDEKVAAVFDDMVARSVPLYQEVQRMVVDLAGTFARPGTKVVDLGCSTATTLCLLGQAIPDPTVRLIGVDSSEPMLEKAREKLARFGLADRVELVRRDLAGPLDLSGASVVLMNWTLQFVRPLHRDDLARRIHEGLVEKGCFLLSEKITASPSLLNRLYIDFYHRFKRRNGYSDPEIARKREALENVLVPYREEENVQLLRRAGFGVVDVFCRWYNFASFLAIKDSAAPA